MKVMLMSRQADFDIQRALPWNNADLIQDLELQTLFDAMASDNEYMSAVVKHALLNAAYNDRETVLYRQDVLRDCMNQHPVIISLYNIAVEAIQKERETYLGFFSRYPEAILSRSVEVMGIFTEMLKKLRAVVDEYGGQFSSAGFRRLFSMLQTELSDEYLDDIHHHLKTLKFNHGVMVSAKLGVGNKGCNYILRLPNQHKGHWLQHIVEHYSASHSFSIADRDEAGAKALSVLKERGLNDIANLLAQSVDHILRFFTQLYTELSFYIGCMNLQRQLTLLDMPYTFPLVNNTDMPEHSVNGLYDICLALKKKTTVVGNDVSIGAKRMVLITGANQGGKTTFLRSVGVAQLMMQAGMFVPANTFTANLCLGLFTHFKREEDNQMKSGKFDEELGRMSEIVDHLNANALMLFNESFAATNEREGSAIARQIVSALLAKNITVFFVTHLYEFPSYFCTHEGTGVHCLRAERHADGERTFRLSEGNPLRTSFGEDLYKRIFQ